jgi:hypothetical protein
MEKNTPKFSSKLRENLKNIPDDLFDKDPNQEVKVYLLQKQFQKQPETLITLIRKMLKG